MDLVDTISNLLKNKEFKSWLISESIIGLIIIINVICMYIYSIFFKYFELFKLIILFLLLPYISSIPVFLIIIGKHYIDEENKESTNEELSVSEYNYKYTES